MHYYIYDIRASDREPSTSNRVTAYAIIKKQSTLCLKKIKNRSRTEHNFDCQGDSVFVLLLATIASRKLMTCPGVTRHAAISAKPSGPEQSLSGPRVRPSVLGQGHIISRTCVGSSYRCLALMVKAFFSRKNN